MKASFVSAGSIFTAFLASLCCIGPFVLAVVGVGSIGFLTLFEAYRAYLLIITFGLLGAGFYLTYRRNEPVECEPGSVCEPGSKSNRLNKVVLWIVTAIAIIFAIFPNILSWLA